MKSLLLIGFLIGALISLPPPEAAAQYQVPHGVVGGGGGVRTGSNIIYDTASQAAVSDVLSNVAYQVRSGFWYTAAIASTVEVTFSSCSGSYAADAVTLTWSVSDAALCEGYHVYRAEGKEGDFERLTAEPLPAGTTAYRDDTAVPGRTYAYRIGALEGGGEIYSLEVFVTLPPRPLTLHQNFPNPFNPSTTIAYFLPQDVPVQLLVYDVSGRLVRTLINRQVEAGRHSVAWDGRNDHGAAVGSGVYYYRLVAGKKTLTRRLVLMR